MQFGNNIEKFGFEKSNWPMMWISSDGGLIYRGRPSKTDAREDEPVWYIQQVIIRSTPEGHKQIETKSTDGFGYRWDERTTLEYHLI